MGLFGRKKDDVLNDWSSVDHTSGVDFSKYDLSSLGDDVRSIVDLPDAIRKTAKWGVGIPIVVALVSWMVFSGRMAGWVLVPFVLGAFVLSMIGSVLIGGFFVARKRLDTVAVATTRVVNVIGEMHSDVIQVKEGASTTSVKQVATGLLEHAVFPVVFGVVEGAAAGASGPFSSLTSKFTSAPLQLVQRSVIGAVNRLPDHEIGSVIDDLTGALPEISTTLATLNDDYQRIAGDIEGVVAGVSKATLGSVVGAAGLAMLPLLGWLLIGWVAS